MTDARTSRPRAFRLDGTSVAIATDEAPSRGPVIEPQPDAFAEGALPPDEAAVEEAQRGGMLAKRVFTWGGLFWSAAGALASLAIGVWLDNLI